MGVLGTPFHSCVPEIWFKLKNVVPSLVVFCGQPFMAEVPKKLTRDMSINGFAPFLVQPTALKIACWLGCGKNFGRWPPCIRAGSTKQYGRMERGVRQLVS